MPVPVKAVATTGSRLDFGKSFKSANEYSATIVLTALSYFPFSNSLAKLKGKGKGKYLESSRKKIQNNITKSHQTRLQCKVITSDIKTARKRL